MYHRILVTCWRIIMVVFVIMSFFLFALFIPVWKMLTSKGQQNWFIAFEQLTDAEIKRSYSADVTWRSSKFPNFNLCFGFRAPRMWGCAIIISEIWCVVMNDCIWELGSREGANRSFWEGSKWAERDESAHFSWVYLQKAATVSSARKIK